MFDLPVPEHPLAWTGERFVPGLTGEVELEHVHRYLFALQFCGQRDVLDIACGEGYGSFLLARVANSVVGIDQDEDSIRHATSTYHADGLHYRTGSCLAIPTADDTFDVVVSFGTLEHLTDHDQFMAEITRVLKPGGLLVLSTSESGVHSLTAVTDMQVKELNEPAFAALVQRFFPVISLGHQKATLVSIIEPRGVGSSEHNPEHFRKVGPLEFEATQQPIDAGSLVAVASADPLPPFQWGSLEGNRLYGTLQAELASSRAHITQLTADLAGLDGEIARLGKELTKRDESPLAAELFKREREVAQLSARVAALTGSLSWKVTAPLRRLVSTRPGAWTGIPGASLGLALRRGAAILSGSDAPWRLSKARIEASGLFDPQFYVRANPDVARAGIDPLAHYMERGAAQGRNPHPLFDTAHYVASNPEVGNARVNPLVHYLARGASDGRSPHPLFDSQFYVRSNPDVAASGANPLAHFWRVGAAEGRPGWSVQDGIRYLQPYVVRPEASGALDYLPPGEAPIPIPGGLRIALHTSSRGNYFFDEIRDLIASGLTRCGVDVVALNELSARPSGINVDLVIAPHEFFMLGEGPKRLNARWVSDAFMLNTEQLHTPWFAKSLPQLAHAPAVFDMNIQSAAGLRRMGIPAHFLPLGWLSDFPPFSPCAVLPDVVAVRSLPAQVRNSVPDAHAPLIDRPIDVLFVGSPSERRRTFFSQSASALSKHHCFLLLNSNERPLVQGETPMTTAAMVGLVQRSKVLLNIHRDEFPYFEWHRMVCQGIWHNTLVVSEPCFRVPWFTPGQHYLECDAASIPDMIDWVLETKDGMAAAESMRTAALELLMSRYPFERVLAAALSRVICPTLDLETGVKVSTVAS